MNLPEDFKVFRVKGADLRWRVKDGSGNVIAKAKTRDDAISEARKYVREANEAS